MGISSNTLWHQTNKKGLKGIIKNKCLYLSYSLEDIHSTRYNSKYAYPMVSVCDIPLAETGNYLKKYGFYTIGFSAEWGRRNHFSTVWYCDQNSLTIEKIHDMLVNRIVSEDTNSGENMEDDWFTQNIVYICSYIKQYEGPLLKRGYKKYRFYDERELRYVPDTKVLSEIGAKQMLSEQEYNEYKAKHKKSPILSKNLNIPFEWEDIKFIIVDKDSEKTEFRDVIQKCSGKKDLNISFFTNDEVREDIIGMCHDKKTKKNKKKNKKNK